MRNLLNRYREEITGLLHLVLFFAAYSFSFLIRFDFVVPENYLDLFTKTVGIVLGVKFVIFAWFSLYKGSWRYVGTRDLFNLGMASAISGVLQGAIIYVFYYKYGFPRSIILLDFIMTIAIVGAVRFSFRMLRESLSPLISPQQSDTKEVFIIGAGDAGESLAREIMKYSHLNYKVVAFIDDDKSKIGTHIHGIPIFGPVSKLSDLSSRYGVKEALIAIPSASGKVMRRIVACCEKAGCEFKTIPGMDRLIDGRVTVTRLRDIQIEDLLRREPVVLDSKAISKFLSGRVVLVTGAGGSIGSEICRQVIRFGPRALVMVERGETALFEIENDLRIERGRGEKIYPYIADICDRNRIETIFKKHLPEVVFHAAAFKHVPMMELNINEAVWNNIFGTRVVADIFHETGGEAFVLISTDKAVNPTSVMGATKRLAEMYVQSLQHPGGPKYLAVRFGNVLDSTGSVIPIFKRQIQKGGPITVTHPEMRRYFMTIPEAAQLVLQAASIGKGGDICILDMGDPIRIIDLAKDLIRLSGLKPDEDIEIIFTGIRQGEKLFEELRFDNEEFDTTTHKQIFLARSDGCSSNEISMTLKELQELCREASEELLRRKLMECVPEYRGWIKSKKDQITLIGGEKSAQRKSASDQGKEK